MMPVLVYHTMPAMAHATPTNFFVVMVSLKKIMPLVTMNTVFIWPTTLYVRGDVAPMNKYVLQSSRDTGRQAGRRTAGVSGECSSRLGFGASAHAGRTHGSTSSSTIHSTTKNREWQDNHAPQSGSCQRPTDSWDTVLGWPLQALPSTALKASLQAHTGYCLLVHTSFSALPHSSGYHTPHCFLTLPSHPPECDHEAEA